MPPLYPDRETFYFSIRAVLDAFLDDPDLDDATEAVTVELFDIRPWVKKSAPVVSIGQDPVPALLSGNSTVLNFSLAGTTSGTAQLVTNVANVNITSATVVGDEAEVTVQKTGLGGILSGQATVVAAHAHYTE